MTTETLTRNQTIVLEALAESGKPLTAYQILDSEEARAAGLKAPPSVYRALDKLIAAGLVHRIEQLNAFVVSDHDTPHTAPAAFMICSRCQKTIEVPAEAVRSVIARAAKANGFIVEGVSIEVSGHCADCTA